MADNYQRFSEVIALTTARERAWAQRVLQATEKGTWSDLQKAGINLKAVDLDDWPGFTLELLPGVAQLWLHADEHGNVDHAGELARAFLAQFHPQQCWCLTWSETCSKPRIGEFGGGGLYVTARSVRFLRATDWVRRRSAAFHRRQTRSSPPR